MNESEQKLNDLKKGFAANQDVIDLFNAFILFYEELKDATIQDIKEVKQIAKEALAIAEKVKKEPGPAGYTPVKGKDYTDGKNYIITDQDLLKIAKSVEVPIVEKVIEVQKTEVIHEQPIVTEVINETKVESTLTGEEMVAKINALEEDPEFQIGLEHIKGLNEMFDSIKKMIRSQTTYVGVGGASTATSSTTAVYGEDLSAQGVGTVYTLAHSPVAGSVRIFRGGARQKLTDDYTISGATITLLSTLSSGEILIADYAY